MELSELTHEAWARLVGDLFTVRLDDGSVLTLELSSAERAAGENRADGAYSVVFTGPLDVALPQRTWPVAHPEIGEHDIFLVPVNRATDGYEYEAVFTRFEV